MMTSMTPFDVPLTVVVPHDTVKTKKKLALSRMRMRRRKIRKQIAL